MGSNEAYRELQKWAAGVSSSMRDLELPAERVSEFARCLASVRLSRNDAPPEPDADAVRAIFLDFFESHPSEDPQDKDETLRIAKALEAMVNHHAQKLIAAMENQPHFGCKGPEARPRDEK